MQRLKSEPEYNLQVVPEAEKPDWPITEEELVVGSQSIEGSFTQYWAYPRSSGKDPEDLPKAEELAQKNPTAIPAVLVDERPSAQAPVVLILTKDGHAWAKTESDISNLEENINSIVDFAKLKFNFKVEHFMTTNRVSKEVEKKLDSVEEEAANSTEDIESNSVTSSINTTIENHDKIDKGSDYKFPTSGVYMQDQSGSNKLTFILIIIIILVIIGGAVYFRQKIFNKLGLGTLSNAQVDVTVSPTPDIIVPTNTPTPSPITVDRSNYKIKVLNGTAQSGLATTLGDKLKNKGWKLQSVGNATSSSMSQTQVHTKQTAVDAGKVMVSDLSPDYQASMSADLSTDNNVDIQVIIGKQ